MAFLLRFDGSDDRILLTSNIVVGASDDYDIEIKFPQTVAGNNRLLGNSVTGLNNRWIRLTTNVFTITSNTGTGRSFNSVAQATEIFRVKRTAGVVQAWFDGVLHPTTFTGNTDTYSFAAIGQTNNTNITVASDLYYATFNINNVLTNNYDPSASGGTGAELIDTVGGNNGALPSPPWPANNSQWVFYDDGGAVPISFNGTIPNLNINVGDVVNFDLNAFFDGTELPFIITSIGADLSAVGLSIAAGFIVGTATAGSLTGVRVRGTDAALNTADSNLFNVTVAAVAYSSAVSFAWPMFSANATQESTVPEYNSSVSATWPIFAVSASQSAIVPQYSTSVSSAWPQLSVSAIQSAVAPSYSADVNATWPQFSVSASQEQELPAGATSVSITWPQLTVSASQSATVPEFSASVSATWPAFTVQAVQSQGLPEYSSVVAATWPQLGVVVNQSATAPQTDTAISATWPMFSVSALVGEFDYFTDPQAVIKLPNLSRRVVLPVLSRRIAIPSQSRRIAL